MLFADAATSNERVAILTVLASMVGGAVVYLVNQWRQSRGEREAKETATQKTIVEHLQGLVTRLDAENKQTAAEKSKLYEEIRQCLNQCAKCSSGRAALRTHIRYLESALRREKIDFVAFVDDPDGDGSAVHEVVPPPTKEAGK